jgi:hypothetical protein
MLAAATGLRVCVGLFQSGGAVPDDICSAMRLVMIVGTTALVPTHSHAASRGGPAVGLRLPCRAGESYILCLLARQYDRLCRRIVSASPALE